MASLLTGSKKLIYIKTPDIQITVKGPAAHPSFPEGKFEEPDAACSVRCHDSFSISFMDDNTIEKPGPRGSINRGSWNVIPMFFEQQRYEIVIQSKPGTDVRFWHDNMFIRNSVTPVGEDSGILSGILNFGNDIGFTDLIIQIDHAEYLRLTLEVYPSKISYREDYKKIMTDVTTEVYNLAFDMLKKTYQSFDIAPSSNPSPVEFFAIIRKIYNDFILSADTLINRPHHLLQVEHEVLSGHKIRRTDSRTMKWIEKHPDQAIKSGDKINVNKALAVRKHVTYDTRENRLTKYMLMQTVSRLEHFRDQYLGFRQVNDSALLEEIGQMIGGIRRRYSTGILGSLNAEPSKSGMSLVFTMAPGYRDLYKNYLLLRHGLSLTGSVFDLSVKDIAVLYEYWCFIKLNSILREHYVPVPGNELIKMDTRGLYVSLLKGQQSTVKYMDPKTGEIITLAYNKQFSQQGNEIPTGAQKPDNVLELKKKGTKNTYEYVFDAKYRINPAKEGTYYYNSVAHTPGPEIDDINTMHRYRDAIVYEKGATGYERTMFGAYVLFPYSNREEYKEHPFFKSIEKVNIGGLPFLPSETSMVESFIDELISETSQSAFERASLPVGIEEKLAHVDWNKRDVLIGTFRSKEQFGICKEKNMYYIPANRIKDEQLPVHYVAMFQTNRIFPNESGIYYYGEVLRTARVARRSITEVPMRSGKDPNEAYYKFYVREWVLLKNPILHREAYQLCGLMSDIYERSSDEEAVDKITAYIQAYPEVITAREYLAELYCNLKMWNNVIAAFESIEEEESILFAANEAAYYFQLALCYGSVKDYKSEELCYRKGLEVTGTHAFILNNLGYSLYKQKKYLKAMEIFEQYLKAERDLQYSANNYVRTLIALGRNKDAKAFIKQNKYKIIKSLKDKVKNLPATNKRINSRQHEPVIQEDEAESALVMELSLSRKAEQFSNEKILEDELTSRIESGLPVFGNHLKVYKRKGEFGRHYIYPLAVLDLLCEDTNGELYIIELKKVSGYDDAYEQIVKYINWFNDCEKFKEKR